MRIRNSNTLKRAAERGRAPVITQRRHVCGFCNRADTNGPEADPVSDKSTSATLG